MRFLKAVLTLPTLVLCLCLFLSSGALGQKKSSRPAVSLPSKGAPVTSISFREEIEPYLKANCGSCHSSDKHNSGFVVETSLALFKGGTKFGGKVIVPGKSAESLLISYLSGKIQPRMPLNSAFVNTEQLAKIKLWIDQGAKIDALKLSWPYSVPVAQNIPKVKNSAWVKTPIDAFVLAKLEAAKMKPSAPASKSAMLRRVYADLLGVPPSPEETQAFLKDASPSAYEKLVDRLLADSRYGERWARHWLDLVRYAETHGFENDGARPRAWRYRDYVIKAFNEDRPYDRFLKEQLAGDELYPDNPEAIIATGYARLGNWDELSTDHPQRWQDYLNDVTDTTGSVMLGLTVGCARCHNHKYDRVSQNDYYRLQSFFINTRWSEKRLPAMFDKRNNELQAKIKDARGALSAFKEKYLKLASVAKRSREKTDKAVQPEDKDYDKVLTDPEDREKFNHLRDQVAESERIAAPFEPIAEVITENGKSAPPAHLLLRGSLLTPGPEVQPGFIASLCGGEERAAVVTVSEKSESTGRRAALANWIASPENPMTAKVMTNRIWQGHFGRGLQGTPSDFGVNGEKTSHPELLDWLSNEFVKSGWSLKKMHRMILLSNVYRQSSQILPGTQKSDPSNKLLSRMNRIRLEGEALRDSILTVSGRLNLQMGGPSVYPKVSDEVLSTGSTHKWGNSPEDQQLRRTIYVFQRRSLSLPIVEAFDGADMANTCPKRTTTTIAPQALALFNGDFSRTEATFFAQRVLKEAGELAGDRIDRLYLTALCRLPTTAQKTLALEFLAKQKLLRVKGTPDAEAQKEALTELCHVVINTNEFLYLD